LSLKMVIFDWDGTLMDSTPRIVDAMFSAAEDAKVQMPTEKQVHDVIGLGLKEACDILFPHENEKARQEALDRYRYHYVHGSNVETPMFEGAVDLLHQLKDNGLSLTVATGKSEAGLKRVFDDTGLGVHFVDYMCADMSESKPSPAMVYRLLENANLSAQEAIVVGDSVHDIKMARNANVTAIGVNYGTQSEETLIENGALSCISAPLELMGLIEHLL